MTDAQVFAFVVLPAVVGGLGAALAGFAYWSAGREVRRADGGPLSPENPN